MLYMQQVSMSALQSFGRDLCREVGIKHIWMLVKYQLPYWIAALEGEEDESVVFDEDDPAVFAEEEA